MNKIPTEKLEQKAQQALKADFHKLYVQQFTTDWEAQRLIRDTEIEIMGLKNLQTLIQSEVASAVDGTLDRLKEKAETLTNGEFDDAHWIGQAVPLEALEEQRKALRGVK